MYDKLIWDTLKPLLVTEVPTEMDDDNPVEYDDEPDEDYEYTSRLESFEEYIARVGDLVPDVPHNVLEYWIYRHYDFILNEYIELGIENMEFVREWWDVEKVYNEIKLFDGEELGGMGYHIFEDEDDKEDWLADYMLEHRTWPEPIIVLDNLSFTSWGKPFHLMEGHRRLDYLREVYQEERDTLKSLH